MPNLEYITSAYGVCIPMIIYGTAWKKDATAELVRQAITAGFRGIDTACQPKHYHEQGVGEGIAACFEQGVLSRDELYLQTKFTPVSGHDPLRIPYDPKATLPDQIKQSCKMSLKNLAVSSLDCLVLHSPLVNFVHTRQVWQAMERLVHSGLVTQLGISNCYDFSLFENLYQAAELKPAVLQNRFYADTGYDRELRQFCLEHRIVYQGFWTLTANPGILADINLRRIGEKYNRSPAQVFFRFLTQHGIVPLTGTTSMEHMRQDLEIFEFKLDEEDSNFIESLC